MDHLIMDSEYLGRIELLYSFQKGPSRDISSILFTERIRKLFERNLSAKRHHYTLFCTNSSTLGPTPHGNDEKHLEVIRERDRDMQLIGEHQSIEYRRFKHEDLQKALGPVAEREKVVAYVCGPPPMTDWAVDVLRKSEGMEEKRVLCEKWW